MVNQTLRELKEIALNLLTIRRLLSVEQVISIFLILFLFSYGLFIILINNSFNFEYALIFLKKSWILLIIYFEIFFVIGTSQITTLALKKIIKSLSKCILNKFKPFKFYYFDLILYFFIYLILSFLLFFGVTNIYTTSLSGFYIGIVLFKIFFVYKLINYLSLTNNFKYKGAIFILPLSLIELIIVLINYIFKCIRQGSFQILESYIPDFIKNISITYLIYIIPIIIAILFLFFKKSKFVIEHQKKNKMNIYLIIFFLSLMCTLLFLLLSYSSNIKLAFRFSQIQTIYFLKETIILLLIFIILIAFYIRIINLKYNKKDIIHIKGKIIGNAVYSYKNNLFGDAYSIEKTINFTLLKLRKKIVYISDIKYNTILLPSNLELYEGDKIYLMGYEISNMNLNEEKKIIQTHIVPLFIKLEEESELRGVID